MRAALPALVALSLTFPAQALDQDEAQLRNWQAPPFWTAPAAEQAHQPAASPDGIRPKAANDSTTVGPVPLPFVALAPCRLIDTRSTSGFPAGYGPPSMPGAHTQRSFTISGQCAIPADAQAVSFNFTVWAPLTRGDIRVFPAGGGTPTVSTLNWEAGILAIANAAVVPLGTGGAITVQVDGAGTIDLIVDVNGYYSPLGVVNTVNGLSGDVLLAEGSNVTISKVGQNLTISAVGGAGGGTVTSVGAGAGLTGGPITTAGTISVAAGGITSSMIATGAVGLSQIDPTQVQARGPSSCPPGSTIQTLNPDGSAVCAASSPQTGFSLSTLDSTGDVGQYTSVTIGSDGLGLISYYDATNKDLKVAHCSNVACTAAGLSTLDGPGDVGQSSSITIGADGLGLISYRDSTAGALKVAHCSNVACSTATISTLDGTGNVGQFSSITIGADGLGLISYYDVTGNDLKVAHCSNAACTTGTLSTLDSGVGRYTSITMNWDGNGLISYYDVTNFTLKVADCLNAACTAANVSTLDSTGNVGWNTSVTIGSDGRGLISYYDVTGGNLKVAHCSTTGCGSATVSALNAALDVGQYTSITTGPDGLGLISYYDVTNGTLKVAHCSNADCTSATASTIDSTPAVGQHTSITIGSDGLGLISYYDSSHGDLKVAHCSNALCTPYVRRR